MEKQFIHLLSPVTIGGKTLKNRMLSSKCAPRHVSFEQDTAFFTCMAKNGAATIVTEIGNYPERELEYLPDGRPSRNPVGLDMTNPQTRRQFSEMFDRIHEQQTLVSVSLMGIEPGYVGISYLPDWDQIPMTGDYSQLLFNKPEATTEQLEQLLDEFAWRCQDMQLLGADMVTVYMSYRSSILAASLSPVLNRRTDRFGGSTMVERASLTKELFRRIKDVCGQDFLIEAQISGEEESPGYTMEDWLDYCEACQGLVDIFQIRGYDGSATHVCGHNLTEDADPPNLRFAEAFKRRGIRGYVSPVGGFSDPDKIEQYMAEGRTDFVSMARRFIADYDYYDKMLEKRIDDIVPCLLCNECHGPGTCAVNPQAPDTVDYPAPKQMKRVAVLGGGPAGMQVALTASEQGHHVTLYERADKLGGQLNAAAVPSFKWPVRKYLDFMISQIEKSDVDLHLNTAVTPELIQAEKFDVVICALGSNSKIIPVPGADLPGIWKADEVYGREEQLGYNVVVIGGANTGRETALHLAQCGHKVTMITRGQANLFYDPHAERIEEEVFLNTPGLSYIDHAQTLEIGDGYVVLERKKGIPRLLIGYPSLGLAGMGFTMTEDVPESLPPANSTLRYQNGEVVQVPFDSFPHETISQTLHCDSIVISGGRAPLDEQAKLFENTAPEFHIIGDNLEAGNIKQSTASGYKIAMEL